MDTSFKFVRYAGILADSTFKHLLGIEGKRSMISLLKTFLPIGDIEDIEYIPTEDVGTGAHDKTIRYDLACRTSDGKYAIVEAQVQDQPYFNHRAMFYASRMINYSVININDRLKKINAKRKSEGKQQIIWNYLFSPVFLLSIFKGTDMAEHSDDGCVHTYRMMDVKTGDLLGPDVSITFVELSKYKWDNVASSTEQQWLYTLKTRLNNRHFPKGRNGFF